MENHKGAARINDRDAVLGYIEEEITFRDGKTEKIKILAIPARNIGWYGKLRDDDAALTELFCDKFDMIADDKLAKLRIKEGMLLKFHREAKDPAELTRINDELAELGAQILTLEKVVRWDDTLTPESHARILEIGKALNAKQFDLWEKGTRAAIDRTLALRQTLKMAPETTPASKISSAKSAAS